jgi:hypothetical protein
MGNFGRDMYFLIDDQCFDNRNNFHRESDNFASQQFDSPSLVLEVWEEQQQD